MNTYKQQSQSQSESDSESQVACTFDKFPQPRTMPSGWDLSELLAPVKPPRKNFVEPNSQVSSSTSVSLSETVPAPGRTESSEGGRSD
jgi:hypothetical protein